MVDVTNVPSVTMNLKIEDISEFDESFIKNYNKESDEEYLYLRKFIFNI